MDNYFEQNVAGERGLREQLLYCGCWILVVALGFYALISAVGIMRFTESGGMSISWMNAILTIVCAALAFVCYRVKDKIYREFDYILWNSELEVCGVYNRRRRKKLATIPLGKLTAWGPADAMAGPMHGAKKQSWCVHPDKAWCVVYPGDSGKEAALLELSEEMCKQIRAIGRSVRDAEVKP